MPHSKFQHVYAIVRFDFPINPDNPGNSIAVIKVLSSKALAEQGISRLSQVNSTKKCRYEMHTTHWIP
jgi:hypothetical protein